jgi:hypothetical protein
MSQISITGASTGTATFTIESPATSTNRTLTLPDNTGTILTNATTAGFPAGSVLQVVQGTHATQVTTTSTSYVTTNLTASITPSSASSKILIMVEMCVTHRDKSADTGGDFTIYRGASTNLLTRGGDTHYDNGGLNNANYAGMNYLDTPNTTSATSYTVYMKSRGTTEMVAHHNNSTGTIILMEIAG